MGSSPPHANSAARPARRRGFSLIEVTVAFFIFTIVSAGLLALSMQSRRHTEENVYESTAVTAAQGYLEQLKNMQYDLLFSDPIPTEFNQGEPDPITATRPPVPADPASWTWNRKSLKMQQTPAGSPEDLHVYFAVVVEPAANDLSTAITVHYFWESHAFGTRRLSAMRSIRTIRSRVPTFP